jgi:antitoxin component HigA of HigAB toxin-antitoxin module
MYLRDEGMDEYMTLVRAFPLVSIKDDEQLTAALAVFEPLFILPEPSTAQRAYLEALTDLIETYENATVSIPEPSGVEILAFLMEQNDLHVEDLDFAFGSRDEAAAVLCGERPLSLAHAHRLSERFHVPIDVFLSTGS